jgi:hypothetical protein
MAVSLLLVHYLNRFPWKDEKRWGKIQEPLKSLESILKKNIDIAFLRMCPKRLMNFTLLMLLSVSEDIWDSKDSNISE